MGINVDTMRTRVIGGWNRLRRGGGPPTVAQTWELYASNRRHQDGVGDEWSNPSMIGLDQPPDRVVPYLFEEVFRPYLGHPSVLVEIGAGGGRFTGPLLEMCDRVIATDTSKSMLEILGSRFANTPNLQPQLLDGSGLAPISDASVDAVFSYGVFVHLQHWDIYNYIAEIRRVLRAGGKAIIHHANTVSDLGWGRFLNEVPGSLNRHKLGGTFTVMTPELIGEFVTRAGLTLEACRTDVVRRDAISLISKPTTDT